MFRKKKAQAAMEFLMTYGWAILVVLVAIAALAYFGVFSPDRWLPSSCTISPGFSCSSYKVVGADANSPTGQVYFRLTNGLGSSVGKVKIYLNMTAPQAVNCYAVPDETFPGVPDDIIGTLIDDTNWGSMTDGQTIDLNWVCGDASAGLQGAVSGSRFKAKIFIEYTKSGEALSHIAEGDIVTKVETGALPIAS